ncbi:MAG TPA: glycoside hydrolase family 31 protein [Acidobacteriaceae bacterium]|nr:glycoside hydrolase family 31 protein [Acidobacteriaceae bacterium]
MRPGMFTIESGSNGVVFREGGRLLRVQFVTESIVRITYTEGREFLDRPSRIVVSSPADVAFDLRDEQHSYVLSTAALNIRVNKSTGALTYFNVTGKVLMREPESGGRSLIPKPVTRNVFREGSVIATSQSIDGVRATVVEHEAVFDREAFEAKLEFVFAEDEALFGLGSHEEGYGNLRGRSRDLYQQNMKAVVPHVVSTRGYSVLLDCGSLMTFRDDEQGSFLWCDVVAELDYYVIYGGSFDGVMRGYRHLTGATPLPPKWAFGYVQSKERYVTADEMIEVVAEYRRRNIPLDCIVLDWKSWPNGEGWGQKSFDPLRFPQPEDFTEKLHALGAKLMVSIWPIMTGGCENQRELSERGLMLGNQSTYNAFIADARACYWEQARRGLFTHGVDAWWCDCTEPFEADWSGALKPSPAERLRINTEASKLYLDAGEINTYSLVHSQGIFEGQRSVRDDKRVLNLTRSSYAGQHRYGTFTWNGDVCATWETLQRCIPEGVNFCATGEAYWTVDAGGFFVDNRPDLWFWRGDYPGGCRGLTPMDALAPDPNDAGSTDFGFWELYTRWLQYAAFLPMFRSHGTDAPREVWRFGEEGSLFYDAIAACIRLRYRLLPYIYSLAAAVTREGLAMVRAVALEFPADAQTHGVTDEFLFGPSLLVCPVTQPMYYDQGSRVISDVAKTHEVYLPAGTKWFDLWSGRLHDGGQMVVVDAPLERIPVFVRAGSIVPMTEPMQFVDENRDSAYELRIFTGADATFVLYEDAGDGYAYERGEYALVFIEWNEHERSLVIHAREAGFPEMVKEREYRIAFFSVDGAQQCDLRYKGEEVCLRMDEVGR